MLDDIYKSAVVLITTHYVIEESDLPGGAAAKALFKAVEDKGWHVARLVNLTGSPYDDSNVAESKFEKEAAKQIGSGKDWYDSVLRKDGKRYLQVATPVPVVLEKCIMCLDHYADVEKGRAIGMISYVVPIE